MKPKNHYERQARRFSINAYHFPREEFMKWYSLLTIASLKLENKRWDGLFRKFNKE